MFGDIIVTLTIAIIACIAVSTYFLFKGYSAFLWHNLGRGERKARAEYARIRREQTDSADAKLSEAEFVEKFVSARPGFWRYFSYSSLVLLVGMPASCAILLT
jgi:hypothetical protein